MQNAIHRLASTSAITIIAIAMAGPVTANEKSTTKAQSASSTQGAAASKHAPADLRSWKSDSLYRTTWSAARLMDAEVYGPDGKEIGDVANLLIGRDGKVLALIAEVGGLWNIGDTHVSIPWDQVKVVSYEHVDIPVTKETVRNFDMFERDYMTKSMTGSIQKTGEDITPGLSVWKASELVGEYANLQGGVRYGYVRDVLIGKDGQVKSLVVNPRSSDRMYGPYAYPFYTDGWRRGDGFVELPYSRDQVSGLQRFDYKQMDDGIF